MHRPLWTWRGCYHHTPASGSSTYCCSITLQVVTDPARLQFYDVWVARDADGKPLSNTPPFVHHDYSLARLRAGLPFPASCCWNGLVSIDAEPFRLGYRFR